MIISNQIPPRQQKKVAHQLYEAIKNESHLTTRSLSEIKRLLLENSVFIAYQKSFRVLGFIVREKLTGDYFELKSWYVLPSLRDSGLSKEIFRQAIHEKHIYLGVTFQDSIVDKLAPFGFKQTSIRNLPLMVALKYITTRHITSILKHSFQMRSKLLIKR